MEKHGDLARFCSNTEGHWKFKRSPGGQKPPPPELASNFPSRNRKAWDSFNSHSGPLQVWVVLTVTAAWCRIFGTQEPREITGNTWKSPWKTPLSQKALVSIGLLSIFPANQWQGLLMLEPRFATWLWTAQPVAGAAWQWDSLIFWSLQVPQKHPKTPSCAVPNCYHAKVSDPESKAGSDCPKAWLFARPASHFRVSWCLPYFSSKCWKTWAFDY